MRARAPSVKYSNVDTKRDRLRHDCRANAPITFDHDYLTGKQNPGDAVSVTNAAAAALTGMGPRPKK